MSFFKLTLKRRRRQWHPTPALLLGKSHGRRSLVSCSPWGREELDTTEWLHFHFSLSCTGEGNGNLSSVLAWQIPGMGEPHGLPSMGSHRVRHDWSDLAAAAATQKYFSSYLFMISNFAVEFKCFKSLEICWDLIYNCVSDPCTLEFILYPVICRYKILYTCIRHIIHVVQIL